uniref:Transposase n=1 Tax=Macrostomum lignano TaxID=282301 RepID=A0A1I8J179_9PLAT
VELLDPQQLWHQVTMDTLMRISLVSPIKPRQWARISRQTFSASLSSIPSSFRRRRLLQQITPGDYGQPDKNFSSFADQASTLVSRAFSHHPDAVGTFNRLHQLVSRAFRHHPDAVGTFNRLHQLVSRAFRHHPTPSAPSTGGT